MTSTTDYKDSELKPQIKRTVSTTFGPFSPEKSITDTFTQCEKIFQLRQLAQDVNQQSYLIENEQCLQMLTNALQNSISNNTNTNANDHILETCIASLQTFQLLAINPKYRSILANVPNLMILVETLSMSSSIIDSRISEISQLLLKTIQTMKHKSQPFKPQPLQIIEITITNMVNEKDRDVIQTIGIKINGIVSVTANLQTQNVTFYCTRKNVQKQLMSDLRINGFLVTTDAEKELNSKYPAEDVMSTMSVHTDVSNFTDSKKGKLSSLQHRIQTGAEYPNNNTFMDIHTSNGYKNGITRYGQDIHAFSLQQRLQIEQDKKKEEEQQRLHNKSFFTKIVGYIW